MTRVTEIEENTTFRGRTSLAAVLSLASWLGLTLLAATSFGQTPGPLQLDLEQALRLAVDQNLSFALSSLAAERGLLAVAGAEALFALELTPEFLSQTLEDGERLRRYGVNASRRFPLGTEIRAGAFRSESGDLPSRYRWTVEVSQPLLRNFGRLVNQEPLVQAHRAFDAAQRTLLRQQADLIVDVVATYLDVLRLRQQHRADEKAAERIALLARVTAARQRLGRATRIDTLRVDLQLGQIEARLQNSLEQLELARRDLAVLVGAEPDARFELVPAPELELEVPAIEEALTIALAHRLDYAQALEDRADSSRQVRIARRKLLPELSGFVRYQQEERVAMDAHSAEGTVSFGLRSSGNVFRRRDRFAVSRAELDQTAEEQRVEIIEQIIARDVQKAWLAHRRSKSRLAIFQRNLEHAESRLELANRLFRIGRGDNFSVVDAEQAFVQAQTELLAGRAAVTVAGYALLRSLGTLVEAPGRLKPEVVGS